MQERTILVLYKWAGGPEGWGLFTHLHKSINAACSHPIRNLKIIQMQLQPVQKLISITFLMLLVGTGIRAQEKKVAPTPDKLFREIAHMDSAMFAAFNKQDMPEFQALFTEDLEWFQDNGGLIAYAKVFENFGKMFKQENKLTRTLIKGSLEVHPIKDYGAIEIGAHKFTHFENGKLEEGTFKFLMIWRKQADRWQISRVISYDH